MQNNFSQIGSAIVRMRSSHDIKQADVAKIMGIDQSRVSRIEKDEAGSPADIIAILNALGELGCSTALSFKAYLQKEWKYIAPPSFWNPERECLEAAEETLEKIDAFLASEKSPWPLQRQIEKHKDSLMRAGSYLSGVNHNIAFIGDQGVGKSTAISFIFDLLMPRGDANKTLERTVLERGGGGTTLCEVHIKRGPEFGLSLIPLSDAEINALVSDFCAARWNMAHMAEASSNEKVSVSREVERAIRNLAGLPNSKRTVDGKAIYQDAVLDLLKSCESEEEFRTRLLGRMALSERITRELWYDSGTRKNPMEWLTDVFKAVNNGRIKDVSLPKSIDLLIPDFGSDFGEIKITVVDTKGVDDVAVREDLDTRLKDSRTTIVFCSKFNDAPGMSARILLKHMRETFSDRLDAGKVAILALPRVNEAKAMKDDMGHDAASDDEGYELKRMQVLGELASEGLTGVPMLFFNAELDDAALARKSLFDQISRMRKSVADRLRDLCAAVEEIMENHETQALSATLQEVANRLNTFLEGNRNLEARQRMAHLEAISTIHAIRYTSTLWATVRRNGEYNGLNILHIVGVGAARDAKTRSDIWFKNLDAFLNSLRADKGLHLAARNIEQISAGAQFSKTSFLEAVQRAGVQVYRDELAHANMWQKCEAEWGRGSGFKSRVAKHVSDWFEGKADLNSKLDNVVLSLWEKLVIEPLSRLASEGAPAPEEANSNIISFPRH